MILQNCLFSINSVSHAWLAFDFKLQEPIRQIIVSLLWQITSYQQSCHGRMSFKKQIYSSNLVL